MRVGRFFWSAYGERNQLFHNDGRGNFRDLSEDSPSLCGKARVGRGLIAAPLFGTGALDLVVTETAGKARLFRNVAPDRAHWLLVQAGHGDEAEKELRQVLERQPDNPRAGYDLGLAALALGETDRARESFLRAARSPFARQKANAQLAAIYQRRRDAKAVAACMSEVTRPPLDLPWEDPYVAEYTGLEIGLGRRYEEASRLLMEGRHEERERLLLRMAAEHRDGRALLLLGEQQLGQGRLELEFCKP